MSDKLALLLIETCFENIEAAEKLIDKNPEIVHERTGLGETALHFLAVENQIEQVIFLFKKGAKINTKNKCDGTPLSESVSLGHIELVKFLLENGAHIDKEVGHREPILHEAIRGKPEMISLLLEYGENINEINSLRETLLHTSSTDDEWLEITKYLVNNGSKIDALSAFDSTPLNGAALHGCKKTAEYLVKNGASLSAKNVRGRTPAQTALNCNHPELAKWLTEHE